MTEFYSTLFPMVLVDSWVDFRMEQYTLDLYNQLIGNFNKRMLDIDTYIKTVTKK